MPWRDAAISLPFTRIDIVSRVPSESGVYGILDGDYCVFIGDSWNLKARLLELAAALVDVSHLAIVFELCADEDRAARKAVLTAELLCDSPEKHLPLVDLPGLSVSSRLDG